MFVRNESPRVVTSFFVGTRRIEVLPETVVEVEGLSFAEADRLSEALPNLRFFEEEATESASESDPVPMTEPAPASAPESENAPAPLTEAPESEPFRDEPLFDAVPETHLPEEVPEPAASEDSESDSGTGEEVPEAVEKVSVFDDEAEAKKAPAPRSRRGRKAKRT